MDNPQKEGDLQRTIIMKNKDKNKTNRNKGKGQSFHFLQKSRFVLND